MKVIAVHLSWIDSVQSLLRVVIRINFYSRKSSSLAQIARTYTGSRHNRRPLAPQIYLFHILSELTSYD